MYHLTMYNISPIQQGIQSYHAGIEYAMMYFDTPEFQQWATKDKVVIILNGGTSNHMGHDMWDNPCEQGSMETHGYALMQNNIKHSRFHEPDLNNSFSGIAFLVDERVWDRENYPDPSISDLCDTNGYAPPTTADVQERTLKFFTDRYGAEVAFLRTWLKQFRLA